MTFSTVLNQSHGNPVRRERCVDDLQFAELLAAALRDHPAAPPNTAPELSLALQGNLTEFATWHLGHDYWALYDPAFTWTANADSPWKPSSGPGIDVMAVSQSPPALIIIEVKSSSGPGANLITGHDSTLEADFRRLFEGDVQLRIHANIGKVLHGLRYVHKRRDLEATVKDQVGLTPSQCPTLQLLGVLVCNCGDDTAHASRTRAFRRLQASLVKAGWIESQLQFITVEVSELSAVLSRVIRSAVG